MGVHRVSLQERSQAFGSRSLPCIGSPRGFKLIKAEGSNRVVDSLSSVMAVALVLYISANVFYLLEGPIEFQNTFLAFSFVSLFLARLFKPGKGLQWSNLALLVLAIVATGYVKVFYQELEWRRGFPTNADLVVGVLLVALVIEGTRRVFGPVIPSIIVVLLLYAIFGNYIPEPLGHGYLEFDRVISAMSVGLQGIYGDILYSIANYVFLFFVFGAFLQYSGATEFFHELGKMLARTFLKAGPAHGAVVGSALVGMITGSPVANAAVVGPFTIPLMKKAGFTPDQAGGVEAAASTGGAIMPPIMGAVAFVMAEMLGVPYVTVMMAAFIPAFLYFFSVGASVELLGRKTNLTRLQEPVDKRIFFARAPLFLIPLAVIVYLLLGGYSPMFTAFWSTVTLYALSLLRKETTMSPSKLLQAIKSSAVGGAELAVLGACLGPLTATMTLTGLAMKTASIVELASGGNVTVALVFTAAVSLFLGTALPIVATYVILAALVAPVLTSWGVGSFEAHFFVLYFGVLSAVTPPTAPPAMVTSKIAGGDFNKTSIWASRFAISSFIIPFIIVMNPAMIGKFSDPMADTLAVLGTILAILALSVANIGYFIASVSTPERALYGIAAGLLFGFAFNNDNLMMFTTGLGLFALLTAWQWRQGRVLKPIEALQSLDS